VLQGYWDESGDAHDPNVHYVCVAGMVASEERWRAFEEEWKVLLDEYGITHFHMRAFTAWQGEFKNRAVWPETRRRELLTKVLLAIGRTQPRLCGAIMVLSAWRGLTDDERSWFLNPYFPCAGECVRLGSIRADVEREKIQHYLDHTPALAGRAKYLWRAIKEGKAKEARAIESIETKDMKSCLPLQTADVWAYEVTKGARMTDASTQLRYPLRVLLRLDPRAWVSYFDAIQLRAQCDGVRRYLDSGGTL